MLDPLSGSPDSHTGLHLPHVEKGLHSEIAHLHTSVEPGEPIIIPPAKRPLLSAENIALLAIIFMLLSAGLGVWSWSELTENRTSQARQQAVMVDSLLQVKSGLESNLDQLERSFSNLSADNNWLSEQLATATNIIAEKDSVIQAVKGQQVRNEAALRAQVQRLQTVKDRYEAVIAVLNQQNADLTAENGRLHGATDLLSAQVSELGQQLEAHIRRNLLAQYKATAFRVELTRRNDKLTVRARRTRELNIIFELNSVPPNYQGNQQLYLVITDDQGRPIASKNPVQTTLRTNKGPLAIVAQATQMQNVMESQQIVLAYALEDRLKRGTYIVSVYSEKGLLGVASFRLV